MMKYLENTLVKKILQMLRAKINLRYLAKLWLKFYCFTSTTLPTPGFDTGAGSGIGKAASAALAKEGAKIIAGDINFETSQKVSESIGSNNCFPFALDVGKASDVKNVLNEVVKKFGQPPTIIVNCAGITRDNFILKMSENEFDEVINVNLKGTYLVVQNCSALLIEHGLKGSIINLASIIGKIGNMGQCNYAASKAGVDILTKSCAMELGKFGIRCNSVLPGFIQTPMVETVPERVKEMFRKRVALGRLGTPQEVAEVILFLASDRSSYVNGASIEVTGGGL